MLSASIVWGARVLGVLCVPVVLSIGSLVRDVRALPIFHRALVSFLPAEISYKQPSVTGD